MALKTYKPTTPGQRQLVLVDRSSLHKGGPVKSLTEGKTSKGGRNNTGRVVVRWQGGGHKQRYRLIDFKRARFNEPAIVERLEYDPNRTAFIALIKYKDGALSYILAPQRLNVGDTVVSGDKVDVKVGNAMPLGAMPIGTIVHNIEMKPGKGGQVARSAGAYAQYLGRDAGYALVRLNSSEVRKIPLTCMATVGAVSNPDHMNEILGKAGRNVWKGRRPSVRGTAMNPIDHPHGGGEGRTKGGRHPVTPGASPPRARKPASTSAPPNSSCAPAKARQAHDPFDLERPVRRRLSAQEGGSRALVRPQGCDQDLVAPFHHPAAVRGRHLRRLQRSQAHSRAGDRGHGRSQAG
jgi:large subunit ribosomal protein L2